MRGERERSQRFSSLSVSFSFSSVFALLGTGIEVGEQPCYNGSHSNTPLFSAKTKVGNDWAGQLLSCPCTLHQDIEQPVIFFQEGGTSRPFFNFFLWCLLIPLQLFYLVREICKPFAMLRSLSPRSLVWRQAWGGGGDRTAK